MHKKGFYIYLFPLIFCSQEHINTKLREANILWRKLCDFYRKVKRKFSADPKNTQTLKELDNEIEIISTF